MSELGNLTIAVSKVQEALKSTSISDDDRAVVTRMIRRTKGNTIALDLTETPISVLKELLKLQDLSSKQRKAMYILVAGESGDEKSILASKVNGPNEFHNAMVALAGGDKADGPNAEIRINGRWYPVHLTSEFMKEKDFWPAMCVLRAPVKVCDVRWLQTWQIVDDMFEDENGEKQSYVLSEFMDKLGMRPLQTNMQDFIKLVRAADKSARRVGAVVSVKSPVLVHSQQNWYTGVDSIIYGTEESPRKVVLEPSLEARNDNISTRQSDLTTVLPFVRIFMLDRKDYGYADYRDVEDYTFDVNALSRLVLEPEAEALLRKIFNSDTSKLFGDIVTGKHGGVVILASGSTGVGKTLTAEVFAENTKRPLYVLEMGELGTSLNAVEQSLTLIFHRAARWNAVLLMDEADVFMRKRDDNLERSAIVGVFLRLMDYFPGLFFLTTNRPDVIDPAFESRIAIHIKYPDLSEEKRARIWKMMLNFAKVELTDGIQDIPTFKLNGRNIRNLVRITKVIHPGEKNAEGVEGVSRISCDDLKAVCKFTPMASVGTEEKK